MAQSKKEIKAQLINELSKQFKNTYESKIKRLETEVKNLRETNEELYTQSREAKQRVDELEEKVALYEDWIQRLQDFCNMTDEDRKREMEIEIEIKHNQKAINEMMKVFTPYLKILNMF